MLKLMTKLIALTAMVVAVRAKSESKITKGTLSANKFALINSNHKNLI